MLEHRNIFKYTSTSPDEKTHNQTDHVLIERRWHSSIPNVRSCRGTDCDTDHYLVAAKVREKLAVSKQAAQNSYVERLNLRKLNALEVLKNYQIKISNRFAALENLSDSKYIKRHWENINENIKISVKDSLGLHKLKQHKP
jgi:hypothetical protein